MISQAKYGLKIMWTIFQCCRYGLNSIDDIDINFELFIYKFVKSYVNRATKFSFSELEYFE